jgi:hypothetical protein
MQWDRWEARKSTKPAGYQLGRRCFCHGRLLGQELVLILDASNRFYQCIRDRDSLSQGNRYQKRQSWQSRFRRSIMYLEQILDLKRIIGLICPIPTV